MSHTLDDFVKSHFCSLYEHFGRPNYSISLAKDSLRICHDLTIPKFVSDLRCCRF